MKIKYAFILIILWGISPLKAQNNDVASALCRDVYVWPFKDLTGKYTYTKASVELTEIFESNLIEQYCSVLNRGIHVVPLQDRINEEKILIDNMRKILEDQDLQLVKDTFKTARRVVLGNLSLRDRPGFESGSNYLLKVEFKHLHSFETEAQGEINIHKEAFQDREQLKVLVDSLVRGIFKSYLNKKYNASSIVITGRIKNTYNRPVTIKAQELYVNEESDKVGLFRIEFPVDDLRGRDKVTLLFRDEYHSLDLVINLDRQRRIDIAQEIVLPHRERLRIPLIGRVKEKGNQSPAQGFKLIFKDHEKTEIEALVDRSTDGRFSSYLYYEDIKDKPWLKIIVKHKKEQRYDSVSRRLYPQELVKNLVKTGEGYDLREFILERRIYELEKNHFSTLWVGRIPSGEDFNLNWLTGGQLTYQRRIGSSKSRLLIGASLRYLLDERTIPYNILSEAIEETRRAQNLYLGLALRYVWNYQGANSSYLEIDIENQLYTKQNLSTFINDHSLTFFNEIRPYVQLKFGWSQNLGGNFPLALNLEAGYFIYSTNIPSIRFNEFGNAEVSIDAQDKIIQGLSIQAGLSIQWPFK